MDDKFFLSMMDKFNSSSISELDFNDGNTRLLLRKESALLKQCAQLKQCTVDQRSADPAVAANADMPQEVHPAQLKQCAHSGISAQTEKEKITSPIVASFYSAPGPDSPPYVKTGTKVKAGQTLCILEAMKMMNHLEAEYDCEIIEVHALNGDLVEFGQELFTVKRN